MPLHPKKLHPLPLRVMHWINAVTIFVMVGSGWKIYNDEVIFGWLHVPRMALTIGHLGAARPAGGTSSACGSSSLNGLAYLTYGFWTGRYRRMLLPIRRRRAGLERQGRAELQARSRRHHALQRRAEAALHRRHRCADC